MFRPLNSSGVRNICHPLRELPYLRLDVTSILIWDNDFQTVPREGRQVELLARLPEEVRGVPRVPGGEMRKDELTNPCLRGDRSGLSGRRMPGLAGTVGLLVGERGLVYQHVGTARSLDYRRRRSRVPRDDHLPP